jgi:Ca2+-binding RTX toxin-like protein
MIRFGLLFASLPPGARGAPISPFPVPPVAPHDWLTRPENKILGTGDADFIHVAGDGGVPPDGYNDLPIATAGRDEIRGRGGDDILFGGGSDDWLVGGTGDDTLYGGVGDDRYFVDSVSDSVTEEENEGYDGVVALFSYSLGVNFEYLVLGGHDAIDAVGNDAGNYLQGNDANNQLTGGASSDVIYAGAGDDAAYGGEGDDYMAGGKGADLLVAGNGIDSVNYLFAAGGVNIDLERTGAQRGSEARGDVICGFENIYGSNQNDVLRGDSGANRLNGRGGADVLEGREGDDIYFVDDSSDVAIEDFGAGVDLVNVTNAASFTLGDNIENMNSTGGATVAGNTLDNVIHTLSGLVLGQAGNDILYDDGTFSNAILDGGPGADIMYGTDRTTMHVDDPGDIVYGEPGTVIVASISYTLANGVGVLELAGSLDLSGTGDSKGNAITGNAGDNLLSGKRGDDYLYGGHGDDILDGGGGGDTMEGGAGNDTYIIDNADDTITYAAGFHGQDTVIASVSVNLYEYGYISTLVLAGTDDLNAIGGGWDNHMIGNAGANRITGEIGEDVLEGGGGDDRLEGGSDSDVLIGGAGADVLTGARSEVDDDTFVYLSVADSGVGLHNRDTITDIQRSGRVDLTQIDANSSVAGDQAFVLVSGSFSGAAGELIQFADGAQTIVAGDVDGDASADFEIAFDGSPILTAADFYL